MIPIPTMVAGDIGGSLAPVPQYVQVRGTNTNITSSATTLAVTQPSSITLGDFGILGWRESGSTVSASPSISQGWTQGTGNASNSYYKLYGASEANPSITLSPATDFVEALFVATNVNQANPLDQVPSSSTFSSGTSFTGSNITSVVDRTFLVSVFVYNPSSTGSAATVTNPSGYTVIGPAASSSHKLIVAIAYKTSPDSALATAGSTIASPTWGTTIAAFSAQVINFLLRPSS